MKSNKIHILEELALLGGIVWMEFGMSTKDMSSEVVVKEASF
jgi:hypothetical protein